MQVHGTFIQSELPGLYLGEIQHRIDDGQQVPAGGFQLVQPLRLLCVHAGAANQLRHARDGVQRCADFMAHIGQESALGNAGGFGSALGHRQLARALFNLRLELVVRAHEFGLVCSYLGGRSPRFGQAIQITTACQQGRGGRHQRHGGQQDKVRHRATAPRWRDQPPCIGQEQGDEHQFGQQRKDHGLAHAQHPPGDDQDERVVDQVGAFEAPVDGHDGGHAQPIKADQHTAGQALAPGAQENHRHTASHADEPVDQHPRQGLRPLAGQENGQRKARDAQDGSADPQDPLGNGIGVFRFSGRAWLVHAQRGSARLAALVADAFIQRQIVACRAMP